MSVRLLAGDCREVLRVLADESVDCVVTSPPYWGLRDYGTATWEGGDAGCDHFKLAGGVGRQGLGKSIIAMAANVERASVPFRDVCSNCGARRIDSQIGLETTYQEYVATMVELFREVRRVLRKDGTLWLNLGDSYYSGNRGGYRNDAHRWEASELQKGNRGNADTIGPNRLLQDGLKNKDLCGIPWRVAFALQADGWWLRQDIIWSKPNPMPESVTDRCTKAHEYLFLLSKSEHYYYDAQAIAEPALQPFGAKSAITGSKINAGGFTTNGSGNSSLGSNQGAATRNKRSVWEISTQPYSEAHFATFPPALIEPCILAGCPEKCCAKCGAPWGRIVEKSGGTIGKGWTDHRDDLGRGMSQTANPGGGIGNARNADGKLYEVKTLGWSPTCSCNAATVPGMVLDPFGGAGTTGLVADRLQRNAVLIELNPQYVNMAESRITNDIPLFAAVFRD